MNRRKNILVCLVTGSGNVNTGGLTGAALGWGFTQNVRILLLCVNLHAIFQDS